MFWTNQTHIIQNKNSLSLSLSLRFIGHFPGEPGLAVVYWSKGWWKWWWQLDYWSYKSCKASAESSPPTNQHPVFYRPEALPVTQPTVSKHWRENITFHGLAYPKAHLGVFQLFLWPLIFIYSCTSRFAYKSTPSLDVKKNIQNLTPTYESMLEQDFHLRADGDDIRTGCWQWQSVQQRAGKADTPLMTMRWRPVIVT